MSLARYIALLLTCATVGSAYAQQQPDWNLKKTAYAGFQYSTVDYALVNKVKYSGGNFRSALFTTIPIYANPGLNINQLNVSDYKRWRGANGLFILRDSGASSGSYTDLLQINGSTSNYGRDFETDAADNYFILADNKGDGWDHANTASNLPSDSSQVLLVKVSKTGAVLWHKTYGGKSVEYSIAIRKAGDGNFIILAQTQSGDGDVTNYNGGKDIWLLKVSAVDGSIIWKKTIGTAADEMPSDLEISADGTMIISGSATGSTLFPGAAATSNAFLLKLDGIGNTIWSRSFGGSRDDRITSVAIIAAGGYVSTCTTFSSDGDFPLNNGGSDVYIIRHNAVGDIVWKKHYGFPNDDTGSDIVFSECGPLIYTAFAKQFTGAPQPYNVYPEFSQNGAVNLILDGSGTEKYNYQEVFDYTYYNDNKYFNEHQVPTMALSKNGGILVAEMAHAKFGNQVPQGQVGNVTRTFLMAEYGIITNRKNYDTSICKGQLLNNVVQVRDTMFYDTLRNSCRVDTLISLFKVHILNADSLIKHDTTICYGSPYKGIKRYTSFQIKDTSFTNTSCGPRSVILASTITVAPKISTGFPRDTFFCKRTALLLKAYAPAKTYTWQDNSHNSVFNATGDGLYFVNVTDTFGCTQADSITITTSDIFLRVVADTFVRPPQTLTLIPQTNGQVVWIYDPTLSCEQCTATVASPADTKTYQLTATKGDCSLTANIKVNVVKDFYLYLPSAFTPNDDANNNILKIHTNITGGLLFEVYNRYGEKVFSTTDPEKGWDGKYRTVNQPQGAYAYYIQYKQTASAPTQLLKGTVLLLK